MRHSEPYRRVGVGTDHTRAKLGGRLAAGAAAEQGGGDGADGQGGHDQDGVPGDCGIQADLGLVGPEPVLAELEIFFG